LLYVTDEENFPAGHIVQNGDGNDVDVALASGV
jgi:hypothetical protein